MHVYMYLYERMSICIIIIFPIKGVKYISCIISEKLFVAFYQMMALKICASMHTIESLHYTHTCRYAYMHALVCPSPSYILHYSVVVRNENRTC